MGQNCIVSLAEQEKSYKSEKYPKKRATIHIGKLRQIGVSRARWKDILMASILQYPIGIWGVRAH